MNNGHIGGRLRKTVDYPCFVAELQIRDQMSGDRCQVYELRKTNYAQARHGFFNHMKRSDEKTYHLSPDP
jgi:hypothetical protein